MLKSVLCVASQYAHLASSSTAMPGCTIRIFADLDFLFL